MAETSAKDESALEGISQKDDLDRISEKLQELVGYLEAAITQAETTSKCQALLDCALRAIEEIDQNGVKDSELELLQMCKRMLPGLQRLLDILPAVPLCRSVAGIEFFPINDDEIPRGSDEVSAARKQLLAREKAVARLMEAEEGARKGQHQFLSGLLHNLAKVLAADHLLRNPRIQLQAAGFSPGLQIDSGEQTSVDPSLLRDASQQMAEDPESHSYFSNMITYIAEVGDELASIDPAPGEAHNYFALLDMLPQELMVKLVKQHGCTPPLLKVATLLGVDLADQVLAACVEPVYPPQASPNRHTMAARSGSSIKTTAKSDKTNVQEAASGVDVQEAGPSASGRKAEPLQPGRSSVSLIHSSPRAIDSRLPSSSALAPICSCETCSTLAARAAQTPFLDLTSLARQVYALRKDRLPTPAAGTAGSGGTGTSSKQRHRLPGLRATIDSTAELTLDLLIELFAVSPLQTIVAAIVLLLQRRDALSGGEVPVLPRQPAQDSKPPETAGTAHSRAASPRSTSTAHPAKAQGAEQMPEALGSSKRDEAPATAMAHGRGGGGASDRELLDFILEQCAERYPPLGRWLQLQVETNPALADLKDSQEEFARLSSGERSKRIKDLANVGAWQEAIRLADLDTGAPDWLLEAAVDSIAPCALPLSRSGLKGVDEASIKPEEAQELSQQWCMSIKDGYKLAELAIKHLRTWSLEQAKVVALWAMSKAPDGSAVQQALENRLQRIAIYKKALEAGTVREEVGSWQKMDEMLVSDPAGLVHRLNASAAPQAALDIALLCKVQPDTLFQARWQHLVSQVEGAGARPAGILNIARELKALPVKEMVDVGVAVVKNLSDVETCKALLQVLACKEAEMPRESKAQLNAAQQGIEALALVEPPWRGRLSHLLGRPYLLLESLVMAQQFEMAQQILRAVPGLHNDDMLLHYARAAVSFDSWQDFVLGPSLPGSTPGPSSGVSSPRRSPAGGVTDLERSASVSSSRRGPTLQSTRVLTGDTKADNALRERHTYFTAPNAIIMQQLLTLASSPKAAVHIAFTTASDLLTSQVSMPAEQLQGDYTAMEQAMEATTIAAEILDQARMLMGANYKAAGAAVAEEDVKQLHNKAQLIQTLLGNLVPVSMADLDSESTVRKLVEGMLAEELYALAAYVAKRWQLDDRFIWEEWATALIGVGSYEEADIRIANAFRIPAVLALQGEAADEEDVALASSFVEKLEANTPVNVAGLQDLVKRQKQMMLREADASLDASDYLLVFKEQEKLATPIQAAFQSLPESQMAGRRYQLAERLLQTYSPDRLLSFMFKHGHAASACQLLYPGHVTGPHLASETDSGDPVTDRYGGLNDLITLAVEHGELRTLQRVLTAAGARGRTAFLGMCERAREAAKQRAGLHSNGGASGLEEAPAAGDALSSMREDELCQYLYRSYQALHMPDDAGLACLRLAWLALTHKAAALHLQNATVHFQDALSGVQDSSGKAQIAAVASVKLGATQLTSMLTRLGLQISVHQLLQPSGQHSAGVAGGDQPQQVHLFSEAEVPFAAVGRTDAEAAAQQRRLEVVRRVLVRNFDLAFAIIHAFGMNASQAYTAAAVQHAQAGNAAGIQQLLSNIRGTSTDQEYDEVLSAAALNYKEAVATLSQPSWRTWLTKPATDPVEALVAQMRSLHSRVGVLLQLKRLSEAAQLALAARNRALVRSVAAEARSAAAVDILAECQSFLRETQ